MKIIARNFIVRSLRSVSRTYRRIFIKVAVGQRGANPSLKLKDATEKLQLTILVSTFLNDGLMHLSRSRRDYAERRKH